MVGGIKMSGGGGGSPTSFHSVWFAYVVVVVVLVVVVVPHCTHCRSYALKGISVPHKRRYDFTLLSFTPSLPHTVVLLPSSSSFQKMRQKFELFVALTYVRSFDFFSAPYFCFGSKWFASVYFRTVISVAKCRCN
jgi:hypothetical protein